MKAWEAVVIILLIVAVAFGYVGCKASISVKSSIVAHQRAIA